MLFARSARPAWQSTTWASAGIEFTGVCSTVTPYFFSFFFMVLATITLLPIPASQAMITFLTSRSVDLRHRVPFRRVTSWGRAERACVGAR